MSTKKLTVADATPDAPTKLPAARAVEPPPPAAPEPPPVHIHKASLREEILGKDELGRRIIRPVEGRKPTYVHTCKACRADDVARMAAPPPAYDMDCTLFLVPEAQYDGAVCREYVKRRYPEAKAVVSAFHAEKMTYVPGSQIVVVTRRAVDGRQVGPGSRRQKDIEDKWVEVPIEPETYLHEVVESRPIVVAECMQVQPATMFSEQIVDMGEFVAQLSEVAYPHRIAIPADPRDRMYVMRAS